MIKIYSGSYQDFKFPSGEQHVIINCEDKVVTIKFDYESDEEIFKLLLICNALKNDNKKLGTLIIPYVPHSRQDRITQQGEPLSIKVFCDLINNLNFEQVLIYDVHSSVTLALLKNCIEIKQKDLFLSVIALMKDFYLISPDGGALKKIYALAKESSSIEVIECSKKRDTKTGKITETKVWNDNFYGKTCVIVDDICDGGKTFIEIAKILKERNAGKIILCVTHGFFTKGIEVFDGLISEIHTIKGRVK